MGIGLVCRAALVLVCGLVCGPGCARGPAVHTIEGSHVVESAQIDFHGLASTSERFGFSSAPASHGAPAPAASSLGLAWTTPPGWTELPASSMRAASFRPAGDERAECYLTLLSGDAGGLAANANRWRTQLSLPAISANELDSMPRSPLLGRDAVLVDFAGTWKGMSGNDTREHWRLIGLLLVEPGGSAFLKMTGPDDVVAAQRDALCALARSFRTAGAPSAPGAPSGSGASGAPSSISPIGESAPSPAAPATDSAAGFTFAMPTAWRRAPERPSRAFSFYAGAGNDLECYVTVLGGDAGGALANVNRWRGQLGLTGITQADLAALPTVHMLGQDALVVECNGTAASLVGAACTASGRSVFVKMTGPRDLVKAQRGAFLAFCSSLAEAK
jgi:hypothetical protein